MINFMSDNKSCNTGDSSSSKKRTFIISDLHLGHANIIRYCNRPFSNVEEMDAALIRNWNSMVSKGDTVYYLGDLSFGRGSKHYAEEYNEILNGDIVLIKGNHYDPKEARPGPITIEYCRRREGTGDGGELLKKFILCHDPGKVAVESRVGAANGSAEVSSSWDNERLWLIHGHHHNHYPDVFPFINGERKTANVSVELIGFRPLDLEYLCELIFDRKVKWMARLE